MQAPPENENPAPLEGGNGALEIDQAGNQVEREDTTAISLVQASIPVLHRCLSIPSDNVVRWLIEQGISDAAMTSPWPPKEARVTFGDSHTFDFDDSGEPALIFRATDHGETIDLVAWQARSGRLASWRGVAFAIGDLDDVFNPATYFGGDSLLVHETPLQWLQAEREGIVILRQDLAHAFLADRQRIVCSNAAHARQIERWLEPPKPKVEILVEVSAERAAA